MGEKKEKKDKEEEKATVRSAPDGSDNKPEGLLVSVTFSHGRGSRFNNVIFLDRIVVLNKLKPT